MESGGYGWTAFRVGWIAQESHSKGPLHVDEKLIMDVICFTAPKAMANYSRGKKNLSITTVCCDLAIATRGKKNANTNHFGCQPEGFSCQLSKNHN